MILDVSYNVSLSIIILHSSFVDDWKYFKEKDIDSIFII